MAALTGFSRLRLNAHTHQQVYAGFVLGMVCNLIILCGEWFI